ncbi:MAG: hypothetical protein KC619_26265 [Myxococcales bacterium]|nr:hypothetical protein [Myxococcales bacterium]
MTGRAASLLLLGALVLAPALDASAQPSAADIAQARSLFATGVGLLRERRWAEGCDALARSNALVETAETHHNLAVCSGELGRVLDQAEHLRAFLRLAGPTIDEGMLSRARADLEAVEPQIPTLVLDVDPPDADDVEIALDGERVPREAWGHPRPVNPGDVVIVATGVPWLAWTDTVTVRHGEQRTVAIELRSRGARDADPLDDPFPDAPATPPPRGGDDTALWIVVITVAAAVLAGGVLATYFLLTANDGRADVPLDVDWRREAILRF